MKNVQCYELFGGIALKNHAFSFFNLYNTFQSAYRPGHSTERALLKVVDALFLSHNKGNMSILALLDFSSAFDTIDHSILVHLHVDWIV